MKGNAAIILITLAGFLLRSIAAVIDPFLHPWDERFHALVARNMMHTPLIPMLRARPLTDNYDPFIWCCNHIWLHKQPLFLWQMAASMKIFGVSEWGMRFPSVIMGTLLIAMLYRIALILTGEKTIALLSAGILAFSNFHLQMIAGIHGMDHNDVAHGFYVLASIWSYAEYTRNPKWYWALLTGVFAGAAILNKWLTGLLVYLAWGICVLIKMKKRAFSVVELGHLALSVIVCVAVFLPWQIYILIRFYDLAMYEYEFNRRHITEALEGHEGNVFYYLKFLKDLVGEWIYFLILPGMFISCSFDKKIHKALNIAFIVCIVFVFLFYSLIVKTKVDTYLFFVVPLAIIYLTVSINELFRIHNKWFRALVVSLVLLLSFKPFWVARYLSPSNKERNDRIYNAAIYRNLKSRLPDSIKVVMNMNSFEDIDVMFYNNDLTAYHWSLTEEDFKQFEKQKLPVAVFQSHGNYSLPDYVLHYPYIYIIRQQLADF